MRNVFFSSVIRRLKEKLCISKIDKQTYFFEIHDDEEKKIEFRISFYPKTYEISVYKLKREGNTKENEKTVHTVMDVIAETAKKMGISCILKYMWCDVVYCTTEEMERFHSFLEESRKTLEKEWERLRKTYNLENILRIDGWDKETLSIASYEPAEFFDVHHRKLNTFGTFQTIEEMNTILQRIENRIQEICAYTEKELTKSMETYNMPLSFYKDKIKVELFYYSHLKSHMIVKNQNRKISFCSFDSLPEETVLRDISMRAMYMEKMEEEFKKICSVPFFRYFYSRQNNYYVCWSKEEILVEFERSETKTEFRFFDERKHLLSELEGNHEEILVQLKNQIVIWAKQERLKQIVT